MIVYCSVARYGPQSIASAEGWIDRLAPFSRHVRVRMHSSVAPKVSRVKRQEGGEWRQAAEGGGKKTEEGKSSR